LSLVNNSGNTFTGNIIVDSGTLRIAGNAFAPVGSQTGFVAGSMTASDTITINRAGILTIDDNAFTGGYVANRFGASSATAPALTLAGGRLNLTGANIASTLNQTFGDLTASSGYSIVNITRNNGTPTLTFDSLAINKGAVANFYSTTLGTGTNDARIMFTNAPTMINGIIAGAKVWLPAQAGVGELATYGANGVTAFSAYDVTSNDINTGTSATTNFAMTVATTPLTLTADRAVNSLNYRANGGTWSLGGFKLTLTSGMFLRNGTNTALTINNGTLTAGNGTDDIDLHIFTAQQNVVIDAVIADNSSSKVSLVKSHGNQLTISGGANNTYTGGTYVVDGTLATGNVANRAYLGTGKVTVDGTSILTLGNIGATSNSTGADYTVINGGQIAIASGANGAYTANDTFNIGAGSVISGNSASGQGLASLDRGIGGGTANITLAEDAIIGHDYALTTALNLTTGTIKNLGTNADLYYAFKGSTNQVSASAVINIGTGTAFKGLSLFGGGGTFDAGTINVATGTTDVYIKTNGANTSTPSTLTFGYDYFAGSPTVTVADVGTLDINVLGNVVFRDTGAIYGNTSEGKNVRFVAKAGSSLAFYQAATGMGTGTGIASALIESGGVLSMNTSADALNGAVTVQAGGRFDAALAGGVTGSGQLTFEEGSIINITNATGFSGSQATAASLAAGTIVRLGATFGTAATTLDSIVGGSSPIYQISGGNRGATNPTSAGTTILTLNKNGSGVGGILTNDSATRTFSGVANGKITLGANGGVIAATSNTQITLQEEIDGAGTLTIGTTDIIDGAPKLGIVRMDMVNANTYTGGTIVNAGTVALARANMLGAITNQLTVNTGGTVDMTGADQTVGNLTGTGGIINANGRILTIGQGDNGGGNYQGSIQGATGKLTKTGTGTITLSGANTYAGITTISGGRLQFGKQSSLYNNTVGSWTAALINVKSGGTLGLNVGGTGEFTTGNVTTLLTNLAASSSATNGMNAGSNFGFDTTNASGGLLN